MLIHRTGLFYHDGCDFYRSGCDNWALCKKEFDKLVSIPRGYKRFRLEFHDEPSSDRFEVKKRGHYEHFTIDGAYMAITNRNHIAYAAFVCRDVSFVEVVFEKEVY